MRNIIITVLIFSGIIVFASYSGIVKINAPENLFGRADEVSSDGFQYVGKVNLLENQQVSSFERQANDFKNSPTKQSKVTNITSIIASVASTTPVVLIASTTPIASTSISIAPIEPIEPIIVAPVVPVASIIPQTPSNILNIGISEILVGIDGGTKYEFIELYNPNDAAIDLTGWSIKKRSSTGSESTLVSASRFEGKKIMPQKYFLLANEGGYNGSIQPDIFWPKSYILAYKNNAVILYNVDGEAIEDIGWDEITKGQSLERTSWNSGEFKIQTSPNPQNSQSN